MIKKEIVNKLIEGGKLLPIMTEFEAEEVVNLVIDNLFEYLKKNYLIKSIEPLRWVSWDKVKSDYLKSIGIYESRN